jgi:dTDP-4-dehydrorhamnose 3,5-epimerase
MKVEPTPLDGAAVIRLERIEDERGWFGRTFDAEIFEAHGLDAAVVQANLSFNRRSGTLRGMHYQKEPHGEGKLVRCMTGALYDVIVDLRPSSPTYCDWFGIELTGESDESLFVPVGVAHGFQTLADDTTVHYQMSYPYVPGAGAGVRWDDPAFGIEWPEARAGRLISERDRAYPDFTR